MIYPSDFEIKLGFDAVRRMLAQRCVSKMGRDYVERMSFTSDFSRIRQMLAETDEMRRLLDASAEIPGGNIYDVTPALVQIQAEGSYMTAEQYGRLRAMLLLMDEVRSFYCKVDAETEKPVFPALSQVFNQIESFPLLANEIGRCINRFGEVKDEASEALYAVRRAISAAQGVVSRAMRRVLDRAAAEGIIEKDAAPAVRDGRMVIPVAAGMKRKINGIVHDESATGKTVFIEPAEVVEAANRLRELEMEEHREVVAVLVSLANLVRPHIQPLCSSLDLLGFMDFVKSKADFARDTGGELPVLHENPEIEWYHAVHPVLLVTLRSQQREVVGLNLRLDVDHRFLIISGPNAGGKSVTLKTSGIVQYMMQCGMLPTLHSNSHMGVFKSIFIDIGDEQSIENDLSTYSSHLRNMKFFVTRADKRTLVLADEMGSGTEPMIGGAIAQSILMDLAEKRCFGIVTTHYQNLKTFADDTEGFINGAMLYDRQHLRPTFQLAVGHAGSSFAIEIARNIGLPRDIISRAQEIVGSDYVNLDKYLLDVARDRRYWANKRQNIKEKEAHLDQLLSKYEDTSADLRSQRAEILRDARREAKEILATANARIEATVKGIRDAQAEKERTRALRAELAEYKKDLESAEKKGQDAVPEVLRPLKHKSRRPEAKPVAQKPKVVELQVGDYVRMSDGGVTGKILGIKDKKAEVAFGSLRTFVELKKLKSAAKPKETATTQVSGVSAETYAASRTRQLNFKREIDVRGMRADEALQAVTYFIDDAIQFGASRVRILHGTGHGILKTLIRQHLKPNTAVKNIADEDVRFGGAGITVVDLDV